MDLEATDVAQLAESYKVRVGLAESVEVAVVAALVPPPVRSGESRLSDRRGLSTPYRSTSSKVWD